MTVALFTSLQPYRVAAAELPRSVRLTSDPSGAVAAVGGERWTDAVEQIVRAGAEAVVVRRPGAARREDLARLAELGIPIVLDRPLARADALLAAHAAIDGAPPFATVVVECHAPTRALRDALRDAVAWTRVLVGGAVRATSPSSEGMSPGGGALALLQAPGGVAVSLLAATSPGSPPLGRVRATGLGETLVEFDGDEQQLRIVVGDATGHRVLPRLFEAPERVALRRATAALTGGEVPNDLEDFAHDEALAAVLHGGADA